MYDRDLNSSEEARPDYVVLTIRDEDDCVDNGGSWNNQRAKQPLCQVPSANLKTHEESVKPHLPDLHRRRSAETEALRKKRVGRWLPSSQRCREFTIHVDKVNEDQLGIDVVQNYMSYLVIMDVRDGAIKRWNMEHRDSPLTIETGDIILEVNGRRGLAKGLVEILKAQSKLSIVLGRLEVSPRLEPSEAPEGFSYDIKVVRADREKLGIEIKSSPGAEMTILLVGEEGLIQAWNREHKGKNEVMLNDIIVEVNGIRGQSNKMVEEMKLAKHLNIRLYRPHASAPPDENDVMPMHPRD